MQTSPEWTLEFYLEANGASPVIEFLDSLDKKTRARFGWSMEQVRLRNVQARYPLVRHLEGDLWEVRINATERFSHEKEGEQHYETKTFHQ